MKQIIITISLIFCIAGYSVAGYAEIAADSLILNTNNTTSWSGYLTTTGSEITAVSEGASPETGWQYATITIGWDINKNNGSYTYVYTFTVEGTPNMLDLLIETPTNFASISSVAYRNADIGESFSAVNGSYKIDTFDEDQSPAHQNTLSLLPVEELHGVRFSIASGDRKDIFEVSFESDYAPTQGNFYANCGFAGGGHNAGWNTGLESGNDFIMVPTPEPTTIALLGLGFVALRRRKSCA